MPERGDKLFFSRLLMISYFLQHTNYDYFISSDIDYVVTNKERDINQYLNKDYFTHYHVVDHQWWENREANNVPWLISEQYLMNDIFDNEFNSDKNPQWEGYTHVSADLFGFSRNGAKEFISFFQNYGWDFLDQSKLAKKYLDYKIRLKDEPHLAAITYHGLKNDFCDGSHLDELRTTSWHTDNLDLINKNFIFHHYGSCNSQEDYENLYEKYYGVSG